MHLDSDIFGLILIMSIDIHRVFCMIWLESAGVGKFGPMRDNLHLDYMAFLTVTYSMEEISDIVRKIDICLIPALYSNTLLINEFWMFILLDQRYFLIDYAIGDRMGTREASGLVPKAEPSRALSFQAFSQFCSDYIYEAGIITNTMASPCHPNPSSSSPILCSHGFLTPNPTPDLTPPIFPTFQHRSRSHARKTWFHPRPTLYPGYISCIGRFLMQVINFASATGLLGRSHDPVRDAVAGVPASCGKERHVTCRAVILRSRGFELKRETLAVTPLPFRELIATGRKAPTCCPGVGVLERLGVKPKRNCPNGIIIISATPKLHHIAELRLSIKMWLHLLLKTLSYSSFVKATKSFTTNNIVKHRRCDLHYDLYGLFRPSEICSLANSQSWNLLRGSVRKDSEYFGKQAVVYGHERDTPLIPLFCLEREFSGIEGVPTSRQIRMDWSLDFPDRDGTHISLHIGLCRWLDCSTCIFIVECVETCMFVYKSMFLQRYPRARSKKVNGRAFATSSLSTSCIGRARKEIPRKTPKEPRNYLG
ncbi:uncharacterized protein BDR25DRAFT_358823 [Lindgomyces ingoldianus]|uniref:Uncharacterized protein n=1 Tax=Lindgomyces ingoldianus TaxID=673940 RepID=A0ACB6QJY8_9PLEO|nr:uncharacterized protein BDR25DRAFT_358823 [Lindgomyces ingoldianus]KAF2467274.1 hypothetical protein BDR25DRAFT_358823 [Lindgomyces ingoldianus]